MGRMSDMDILADEVQEEVRDGMSPQEAIDEVAGRSVYDRSDIKWAYRSKHG